MATNVLRPELYYNPDYLPTTSQKVASLLEHEFEALRSPRQK